MAAVHGYRVSKSLVCDVIQRKHGADRKWWRLFIFQYDDKKGASAFDKWLYKWIVNKASSGGKSEWVIRGPLCGNFVGDGLNT